MEIISTMFSSLWTGLDEYTVPLVNLTIKEFLIAIFILFMLVQILNFFLGKHGDGKGN